MVDPSGEFIFPCLVPQIHEALPVDVGLNGTDTKLGTVQSSPPSPKPCIGTEPSVLNIFSLSVFFSLSPFQSLSVHFSPYTGLSKRKGDKLRESFCPAAASHSRPCQASA